MGIMNESQLLELKKKIDEAKTKVSELNGQKSALLKQLEEFGCKTITEAEKKLEGMEKEISGITEKIDSGTKELEMKYNLQ
jgi:predicted nuclease with TOPRIM domain